MLPAESNFPCSLHKEAFHSWNSYLSLHGPSTSHKFKTFKNPCGKRARWIQKLYECKCRYLLSQRMPALLDVQIPNSLCLRSQSTLTTLFQLFNGNKSTILDSKTSIFTWPSPRLLRWQRTRLRSSLFSSFWDGPSSLHSREGIPNPFASIWFSLRYGDSSTFLFEKHLHAFAQSYTDLKLIRQCMVLSQV